MNKRIKLALLAVALVIPFMAHAEGNFFSDLQYEVNAGTNIGGASPIPLPREIREINSYSPNLNLLLGATVTKWLGVEKKWGVAVGARVGTKGMKTKATVKNYGMEILDDGNILSGRWTGKVQTKYHTQQLVIPITAVWKVNKRLRVNFGPYLSYAFDNDFSGYVYEGYLREGDPTGDKYVFEGDSKATYDFSDNVRKFQWGIQGGVSWMAYNHLAVNANLTWGCNNIFVSSFKTVSFNMYPIYLNVGFGYIF
jgi:hypothetical protein